jgi:hypothetical protein
MATNPDYAKKFNAYTSEFNHLRGAPLPILAASVYQKVAKDIQYVGDSQQYHQVDYMAAPAELDDGNYDGTLRHGKSPYKLYDAVNNHGHVLDKSNFSGTQRIKLDILEFGERVKNVNGSVADKVYKSEKWAAGKISGIFGAVAGRHEAPAAPAAKVTAAAPRVASSAKNRAPTIPRM